MNGAQDLGGMMGFGPVRPESDEPIFHARWEARALALTLACGALGEWNIDISRHTRESIHPARYLSLSYYEIWIEALTTLLARCGLVTPEELSAGRSLGDPRPTRRPRLRSTEVAAVLARGGPCDRPAVTAARFAAGDRIRTRTLNPPGHTRLPRYARGKTGVIERVQGGFVFPDSSAHGGGDAPQWVYNVVFTGRELWGGDSDPNLTVALDCWESYLEHA